LLRTWQTSTVQWALWARPQETMVGFFSGFLITKAHGSSLGCRWRRWPPDMEGSCKYIA
jgi:hypothetical protein